MARSVIITCAPTGGIHMPTMSPHLPVTPEEIATAADESLGHSEASPDEARERLGLKGADRVTAEVTPVPTPVPTPGPMQGPTLVAAVGGGLIGRSWAVLFLAAGHSVSVFDPDPATETRLHDEIARAWPVLTRLGLATGTGPTGEVTFTGDARAAVDGAAFVQESIPERLGLKHALYAEIEDALPPDAIVSTSASGLTLSQLQAGWRDPSRFVLGHPFNPPHLIPLVEVMGNERTAAGVVDSARAFYESVGKVTIEVRREVPGHVANRLQAALWREAISLVNEGVATVADVDTAVSSGPGLRWAVMGPNQVFNLGGDERGLAAYCEHFADSYHGWWDSLGDPRLDAVTIARLVRGVHEVVGDTPYTELTARRDAVLTAVVAATHPQSRP